MSTLYWITVLGNISDTGLILLIVLLSVAGGAGFFALINCPLDDEEYKIKTKKAFKIAKDCLLYSIIPFLMAILYLQKNNYMHI